MCGLNDALPPMVDHELERGPRVGQDDASEIGRTINDVYEPYGDGGSEHRRPNHPRQDGAVAGALTASTTSTPSPYCSSRRSYPRLRNRASRGSGSCTCPGTERTSATDRRGQRRTTRCGKESQARQQSMDAGQHTSIQAILPSSPAATAFTMQQEPQLARTTQKQRYRGGIRPRHAHIRPRAVQASTNDHRKGHVSRRRTRSPSTSLLRPHPDPYGLGNQQPRYDMLHDVERRGSTRGKPNIHNYNTIPLNVPTPTMMYATTRRCHGSG